jgi:hypothetical protein
MELMTLDTVVKTCLMDKGETSTRFKQQYLNFAIQVFRRLNLAGMLPTTKTVLLDIDSNTNTALLPDDYIDYLKVGLCVGCSGKQIGGFVNLTYNPDICSGLQDATPNTCGCAETFITDANNVACGCTTGMDAWYYHSYWYNGGFFDGAYGYGAGVSIGGFNVFLEQGKIAFDSFVSGEKVLLEYKSNGMAGAGTVIPETAFGTIRAGIHLEAAIHSKDRTTRLDVVPYQQAFNREYLGFRARNASQMLSDWKHQYYKSMRQSIKR